MSELERLRREESRLVASMKQKETRVDKCLEVIKDYVYSLNEQLYAEAQHLNQVREDIRKQGAS